MISLLANPAQIVTVNTNGKNSKRGKQMNEISPLTGHSIVVEDEIIKDLVPDVSINKIHYDEKINLANKTVLPGLIECHTHTAFTGSRAGEFREKLSGVPYEEIAEKGGGINATVQAVRVSSFDDILIKVKPRIDYFISQGITTLEIKSGYGLDFENEVKLLKVINKIKENYPIEIIPTFLGAHTYPPEFKDDHEKYLDIIVNKMLPHISDTKSAEFCDAFCEATAFSAEETDRVLSKAVELGLKIRLHTEQFNNIGGLDVALKNNAFSVDHLEVMAEEDIPKLVDSKTTAVLLPGVSFFLNYDYAPARKLIDNNAVVALSTDYNPGSSHIANLFFIMSLAALKMKMTIEETISAVTINAAKVLDMNNKIGSIEINKNADFAIFDTSDFSDIIYNVGKNLNEMTIKNGKIIYRR